MNKHDAAKQLQHVLASCTDEQTRDINTLLELGAGHMSLRTMHPDQKITFGGPESVPNDRREAYVNLVDAVYDLAGESEDYPMPRAGGWEYVIATLVIEQEWESIAKTAADLRKEEA